MWQWFRKSGEQEVDSGLQKLAGVLVEVAGGDLLSDDQKFVMRKDLMEAIDLAHGELDEKEKVLSGRLVEVAGGRFLSNHKRKLIFEELMEQIAARRLPWRWAFRSWRAGLASLMIFLFVLTSFVIAPVDLRVTRASKWTFLEAVAGEVFVNRDGKIMAVDKDFSLQEGDLVFTGVNSFVTIRYLDDSVTRLGENTSLEMKKLYVRPDNAVQTQVELSLVGGQIWASVYNLIDSESKFVVETGNARADVNSKATFELKSTKDSTVLTVFDNVVDVSKKSGSIENIQPVIAGFKAEVKDSTTKLASLSGDIVVEKNNDIADKWVITNLDLDQQHQEKLKEENLQFASSVVASDSALGALADFKDKTRSLFANADVEAARQRFLDVHMGIIKVQDLLAKADSSNDLRKQATPLMIQYKTALREIMANFVQLHGEDAAQADSLLAMMQEEVALQRKALSLVMPDEKLYVVKEVVNEAGLALANDASDKAGYLLDESKNRLLEMQNLIAKNDLKGAEASFRSYLTGLDDLVQQVEYAKVVEIEGGLFALLDDQIRQCKQLAAIQSELDDKEAKRLAKMVGAVKIDSAKKLVSIVQNYRENAIPFETVLGLKNTIEEYFTNADGKKVMAEDLGTILAKYPEYKDFLAQQENQKVVQSGDQTVVIKDQPASPDLQAVGNTPIPVDAAAVVN